MRKLLIPALLLALMAGCKDNSKFTISGKIENAGNTKKVMLYETDQLVDSAFLNETGEFKFTRVSPDPNFYTLVLGDRSFLVIARNGDELDFHANLSDPGNAYRVDGSEHSEKIREFNKISNDYGKIYQELQERYSQGMSANPEAKDSVYNSLMPVFRKNMSEYSEAALRFAEDNKDNLAGFYAAGTVDQVKYEDRLIRYAEDIRTKFPNNPPVKDFVDRMIAAKPVSVGQPAPAFELPSPEGKTIALSDYRGKYVLVDFWASWCGPCREENPNIVKQYQAFRNRNFTVLGVSLDDNKAAWLKAIKDDKLDWDHVSELKRWDSEVAAKYRVEGIPASFLLDPSGKIIAKSLAGQDLEDFLKKTLK